MALSNYAGAAMARHNWRPAFLAAIQNSGNVRAACQAAAVSRAAAYKARAADPKLAAEWDEALADAVDMLEAVAWDRARSGLSDQVLMMLLRAHRPQLYRERVHVEVTRDQDIDVVMRAGNMTRAEAEQAIAEAERIIAAS